MNMLTRTTMIAASAALISTALALPAQAMTPMPGSACEMTGMVTTVDGVSYVCDRQADGTGAWSKPLANAKAKITMKDGWAKAAPSGMSGAFGVVMNPTTKPVRLIGAASPVAGMVQIHEMVMKDGAMVMQEVVDGLVVPAKGSLVLKPGGNHLMFMNLKKPIKAGQFVPVSLLTEDGTRLTVKVMAKNYTGANEEYDPKGM